MAENYCGKSCVDCGLKEKLNCSGCKAGPGRTFGGECELAKCCQERGHDTCATCTQNNWCSKQKNAEGMAQTRFQRQERERQKREQLEKKVPMLAKCLTVLFWLNIVSLIPSVMGNDLTKELPTLYRTGQMLTMILSLTVVVFYFVMAKANERYRKAAFCIGAVAVVEFVLLWITGGVTPSWTLLINIPAIVVGFVGRYNLYTAHSEILEQVDATLSEQWLKLWKWYIYLFIASIGSVLLLAILPILGLLTTLAAVIGTVVVAIMELIYLYRMMDHFRTYAKNLAA
jgi:hypothetical protein